MGWVYVQYYCELFEQYPSPLCVHVHERDLAFGQELGGGGWHTKHWPGLGWGV